MSLAPSSTAGTPVEVTAITRTRAAKPAALLATARKPPTDAGAPAYTSGAQKWNGTAEILNAKPANTSTAATTNMGWLAAPFATACPIVSREVPPDSPTIIESP